MLGTQSLGRGQIMIEKLIHIGLKHKLLAIVTVIAVCALGVRSMNKLSIDAFPDISPNLVQVFAEIEGMAPEEAEQLVTRPVEIAMRSIPGVHKIRSLSSLGLSTVNVYFEDHIDIYHARQLVAERLKHAEEGIPHDVEMPHGLEMGPVASGMGKILAYYLEAEDMDVTELRSIQDWTVKRGIETLPGVAKVISQGGFVKQYEVALSPENLLAHDLTPDNVIEAIKANNANIGAGVITRGSEELVVRSMGRIMSLDDIGDIVVKNVDGGPVVVRNLGEVRVGKAFRRGVAILNGNREIVVGGIYKLHGANSFEVINRIKERIEEINKSLPPGVKVVPYYDQSSLVRSSIRTVNGALLLGLVLVCLVAFMFLGNLRNALIMVCSLPFSVLFGIITMQLCDMPGDLISFGGIAIALGMIIDSSIIMVEKLQTAVKSGEKTTSTRTIILTAAKEVGRPISFAVGVIVVVFLPIFTLGEIEGKMFRPLAFAVAATMGGSLLYALLIAPIFYRILHKADRHAAGKPEGKFLHAWRNHYEKILLRVIKHPAPIAIAMVILMAGGLLWFSFLGREFVPTLQEGTVQCLVHMNPNVSLDEIKKVCAEVATEARKIPEVLNVIVDIGYGEVGPHIHHTNYGCITITLKPGSSRHQKDIVKRIDARLADFMGTSIGFSQPINHEVDALIAGAGAQVVLKVFGEDMDRLQLIAADLENIVAHIDGAADVRTEQVAGQTQLQVILDSSSLSRYGLTKHEVQTAIRQAITGQEVGHLFAGEKSFRILVRLDERYQEDRESLGNLLIRTPDGKRVPVKRLAEIKTVTGLRQISREGTERYISVLANVRDRDVGTFVRDAQNAVEKANVIPSGYRPDWGGQFELQQAANRRLAYVIPVTLALVICMLYGLFGSARFVWLIMLNVPLALVGGIIALAVFGENISIPSSIGFIALFGIALQDGVVLLSHFQRLRQQGLALKDVIVEGCRSKFRPVIMTTITTALGLLPLIIARGTGSEIQRPLAIVVVFGLATSTAVTLLVIPTAYMWLERRRSEKSSVSSEQNQSEQ